MLQKVALNPCTCAAHSHPCSAHSEVLVLMQQVCVLGGTEYVFLITIYNYNFFKNSFDSHRATVWLSHLVDHILCF